MDDWYNRKQVAQIPSAPKPIRASNDILSFSDDEIAPSEVMDVKLDEEHFKKMAFYRQKMSTQRLHSALKSFNVEEAVRMSGVYEILRNHDVIYIGGNPYFSSIRDCLNAHFSGNDGLSIGAYLSGEGKGHWKFMTVRWMACHNPHEVAFYLLEDYQGRVGHLPLYNNPPAPVVASSGSDTDSDSSDE